MFGFGGPPLGGRMQSGSRAARGEHGASRAASEEAEEKRQASETGSEHQKYLTDCRSFYSCIYCRTHLANHDDLVSRSFQGNRSRAYLFNKVINTVSGPAVQRALNTGAHAVSDLHCNNCATTIGWKYERAYVESQKYKEGKYIIELAHVVRENRHLEFDKCEMRLAGSPQQQQQQRLERLSKRERRRTRCSSTGSSTTNQDEHEQEEEHQLDRLDEPANWDEVDELMFPICEDLIMLAADRSSFSSTRRSLYLDSPAYAWKYSGSASQHCATSGNSISSSASSSTSSPAASSSSSAAAASSSSCAGPSAAAPLAERRPRLDSDTQFSIEADNDDGEQEGRACRACGLEARSIGPQTCCDDEQSECGQMVDASDEQAACSRANSMEIDDRHFFDCYTDHDISNSQS